MKSETQGSWMDYDQFCTEYGFVKGTAYSLVSRKQIPHVRISSRMVRFSREEIEAWLKGHSVEAIQEARKK